MNSLTFPILRQLADGKFHSGEALAQQFKVTRATVWNAIQHAQALNVSVFSVRGRGYQLPKTPDWLDEAQIHQALGEFSKAFSLQILDEVNSTNTYLMQAAAKGAMHGTCVAANVQTQGRGRRGRTWISGMGASLTFSVLWRFQCGAAALSGLSLAVGVAMIRALHELKIDQVKLKWPNDLLVNVDGTPRKLAGILIDLQGDMDGPSAAVIGVGINLNLPEQIRQQIDQAAIGLNEISSDDINRNRLLGTMLKYLAQVLQAFERLGFAGLRDEWLSYHAYHNQLVNIIMPDGKVIGSVIKNVAEDGVLLVETTAGLQRFSAGEISLRLHHDQAQ